MAHEYFVSYSREDGKLVGPMVELLRIGRRDSVFLDGDSIELGDRWWDEIKSAIEAAHHVLVVWCHHAKKSEWVLKELKIATGSKKKLIPVRFDGTELHKLLAPYQSMDLRERVEGSHVDEPAKSSRRISPLGVCANSRPGPIWGPPIESSGLSVLKLQLLHRQVADAVLKKLDEFAS
jgi:hypothetical protein